MKLKCLLFGCKLVGDKIDPNGTRLQHCAKCGTVYHSRNSILLNKY